VENFKRVKEHARLRSRKHKIKLKNMYNDQLEFSMSNQRETNRRSANSSQRRAPRARWWFERMRQIVDHALDWEPAPPPRPEQMFFDGAHRQPLALPASQLAQADERQICE
jgi:hypothetical protein